MHIFLEQFGWISLKKKNKSFKLQEDEIKLKIWNIHDEALIEAIKMDIWNIWFEARIRKLRHFKNAQAVKPEVPIFTDRTTIWVEIFIIFG
jgi:hypothetical protein